MFLSSNRLEYLAENSRIVRALYLTLPTNYNALSDYFISVGSESNHASKVVA